MVEYLDRTWLEFCNKNNINIQLLGIYKNFITYTHKIMFETYIGDEYMGETDRNNHYDFCWNESAKQFNQIGLDFTQKTSARDFFKKIAFKLFYNIDNKPELISLCKTRLRDSVDIMFRIGDLTTNNGEFLIVVFNKFNNG